MIKHISTHLLREVFSCLRLYFLFYYKYIKAHNEVAQKTYNKMLGRTVKKTQGLY